MNWYKIRVKDGSASGYTYVGCSPDAIESLAAKAAHGEYVCLNDLLYYDRGDVKEWAQWDSREVSTVYINPVSIVAIQPFKGDPRTLPKQPA